MKRRPPERDGFFNVAKPSGLTSRDVVNRVCRIVGSKRVGHAGTLDPLATGVLVVAVGKATRLVEYVQAQRKTYRAGFLLGRTSKTDDVEGVITIREGVAFPSEGTIREALRRFEGRILQTPPAFSAIKHQGKRAYDLARSGAIVDLKPRLVEVFRITLEEYEAPRLRLEIECGSGTYIRAIARDLGEAIGVGGLMESLERTAIGVFQLADAVALNQLEQEDWRAILRPLLDGCAGLPMVNLNQEQARRFQLGQGVTFDQAVIDQSTETAVVSTGTFLGIGSFNAATGSLRPLKGGFSESG
nr:tRNA pseudouridine synthase B [uncultured bacterium]